MTPREKLLAMLVGGSLAIVALLSGVHQVWSAFESRHQQIDDLNQANLRHQTEVKRAKAAQRHLAALGQRSLPADPSLAQSLYQAWLVEQALDSGFQAVRVTPNSQRRRGDLYVRHSLAVSGDAEVEQVIRFLHTFYSTGYLHRISRLTTKPITDSKRLNVSVTVEALSMQAARREQLPEPPAEQLAHGALDQYLDTIGRRNFFSPANNPPRLERLPSPRGNPNRLVSFKVQGNDPEGDPLTYSLGEETGTDGVSIDPQTGEFRFVPTEPGEYEFAIRATDQGYPALSDTQRVRIVVEDPPPEQAPAVFDPATQSVVTGITETNGNRQAWISIRTEGRVLKVAEGEQIEVGSFKGVVREIRVDEVDFELEDGRRVLIRLGRQLVDPTANLSQRDEPGASVDRF